ncbi:MAG: hypothetical protein ACI9OJ_003829, partial [Myxococcota bacterium]
FTPRFDSGAVRSSTGTPCPWPFPYLWTQTPADLLVEMGFPRGHGPDIHQCLSDDSTLVIPIAPTTRQLIIQLSDEGSFGESDDDAPPIIEAHIEAEDARDLPLALEPRAGEEKLWFTVPLPLHDGHRELHLKLRPRGPLGFIDVY